MDIDKLTYQELIDLNRRIVERLKLMDQIRTHSEMMQFRVGESVRFCTRSGQTVQGMLVKYNRKTVTVITEDGEQWNVSPHALSKAGNDSVDVSAKVIDIDEASD